MSSFDLAIPTILMHEGGWVSDPQDLGGETNYGISMLMIRRSGLTPQELGVDNLTTPGCLKKMTVDGAKKIYLKYYWAPFHYDSINDQTVATKIFDCGVNCGNDRANVMAQKAANACGQSLTVDGSLGPKSFAAINACDAKTYIKAYADEMTKYYLAIIKARPANAKFQSNWLHRAQWGVKP